MALALNLLKSSLRETDMVSLGFDPQRDRDLYGV
jgi:hypothetical protein